MQNVSNHEHFSEKSFEKFVRELSDQTQIVQYNSTDYSIVEETEDHQDTLEKAYLHFSGLTDKKKLTSSGVEWFLDNYYVTQETVTLIQDDLPKEYFYKLPSLEAYSDIPRIYYLAKNIITHYKIEIMRNDLQDFLKAYQEITTLQMSELWALPLMLRLVLVEILAGTIFRLIEDKKADQSQKDKLFPNLDPDEIVARVLRTMLLFDRIDWKKFIEKHSAVEKILQRDPSRHYSKMDFDTRDQYRKKIEKLAENSDFDEIAVAETVVSLANDSKKTNKTMKSSHIGYYLLAEGEIELEEKINYHQGFKEKLQNLFYLHKTSFYLISIVSITLLVAAALTFISRYFMDEIWNWILIGFLSLIPASSVAVNIINSVLTATLPPKILPKMNFSKWIPKEFRTMVGIPALLTNQEDVKFLLDQLELHYLANMDNNIGFVLLTDFSDAPEETIRDDQTLLNLAVQGIEQLNDQYHGDKGRRPFYLFHRRRQWNQQEDAWMGWERKRGKLADFNRYLIEGFKDSFDTVVGDLEFLESVKFVITVDADTILPRDSAKSLIATLAHPLNQAEFDTTGQKVISGYTILQPRTEVKPTSVNKTLFTRVFAGDLGLDLYTRAVSDVYQDLFGEGIYVGKGIYDVAAFQRSLAGKVPENALLSHDLFEGVQGRAGLVSDIVFFEEYPPDYASEVMRLHRWVRGDWQLLPWLFPRVPDADGNKIPNPLKTIDLWKIFDNLRRSLLAPSTLILLVAGWMLSQKDIWLWTLLIFFVSAFPLIKNIVSSFTSRFLMGATSNVILNIQRAILRWFFWLIFLPYEALIMVDAIFTTLARVYISQKRLLQWQTSAHTVRLFGKQRKIAALWQRMISSPVIAITVAVILNFLNPSALIISAPLLVLWAFAPQFAYWISKPSSKQKKLQLSSKEIQSLRIIARKTWLFFERFVGPEDHWLPPDHFQEDPKGVVAHRTSPTNIGLMLLSTAAAHDFGYIGALDFVYRVEYTFETLDVLEKYRGHLLNWYDTRNLETLSPRYVSTVDSGNYAISLIGLYQTLIELPKDTICPSGVFQGVYDSLEVFSSIVDSIENENINEFITPLQAHCRHLQKEIKELNMIDSCQMDLLTDFEDQLTDPMNSLVNKILTSNKIMEQSVLQDLRYWTDAIFQHLTNIQAQIRILAPWAHSWKERPEFMDEIELEQIREIFSVWYREEALSTRLEILPELCTTTIAYIRRFIQEREEETSLILGSENYQQLKSWMQRFSDDLKQSSNNSEKILQQIQKLLERINFYIERMEFDFLYDTQREVFYLGYNLGSGRLDNNHYDLLASEARTASLFAIAQNEVPRSHWLHMSRPFTSIAGIPTMISWNGSMFEYLMPNLFTNTYPETLLHQTSKGVVQAQINYAKQNNVPWGISESSYYRFDQADNYQYKGFGVPILGRKRGLADDLVIAPYASLMAVGVSPAAVIDNIDALINEGALGHCGFYESIDYTTTRLAVGQHKAVIKSYMAHHQGMILVALANFLNNKSLVDRIHENPYIKSTELLLQEQIPQAESKQEKTETQIAGRIQNKKGISVAPWTVDVHQPGKSVHILSNGSMQMLTTESGSGYLAWKDVALTRWRNDPILDPWGNRFYFQDMDHEKMWMLGIQPIHEQFQEYRVLYSPHMIEIRQVIGDIRIIIQSTITPNEDVCLQKISLTNQSNKKCQVRLLSYGEVVLAPQTTDQQHPAFNQMFIESRYHDDLKMLRFDRRKRSSDEQTFLLGHLLYDNIDGEVEYESDRARFLGRGHQLSMPIVFEKQKLLSGTTGTTLDPIFSIGKQIILERNQTVNLTYITLAGDDGEELLRTAKKYRDANRINHAFAASESHSEKLLRALDLNSGKLAVYQSLLSYIIYPIAKLRPDSALLNKNILGQAGLWPFGISGDYPILLIMIDQKDEIDAIQDMLLAHTYWRKMGLKIDLVIVNTKDSGYAHELNEKIHQVITIMDSQSWVNRRGGIFVLTESQIEEKAVLLLKTASNVVIDLKSGNLEDHLKVAREIEPHLPQFVPSVTEDPYDHGNIIHRPENLVLDNDIGGFSPDGKEYQIYLEDYPKNSTEKGQITPAPWINVIANENFGFLVTESGGGYTWAANSGENRLTPWTNDPVADPSGESLYLRDEITGKIWSPTPYPAGENTNYLCRHGQGYTIFESINQGFNQKYKVFADSEAPVKIIELTLTNQTGQDRRLTATYYAEWVLGTNRDSTQKFIVPIYDHLSESIMAKNSYNPEFSECVAFLTSNLPIHGVTADREEFLGSPGDRHSPAGLRRVGLSGSVDAGGDVCAALQVHINFKPKETCKIVFAIGQGDNLENAKELAQAFSDTKQAAQSWINVRAMWDRYINAIQIKTPDSALNILSNNWLIYQTLSCRIWGRSAFYQSSGAYGFRDQLQDVLALLTIKPEIARIQILRAAKHQFDAGDVLHWWHPPSGRGVRTRISDDLLWLIFVTSEYVRKTGDQSILSETEPFRVGKPLDAEEEERYGRYELSNDSYTLFDHCRRAMDKADTAGPHGLPLIGTGDWNDGMNRVGIKGKGESVWLAWFVYENHRRFAELCEMFGENALAREHEQRSAELQVIINDVAWDGDWFIRAFYDDGTPLGSKENLECQIDSLPQSWSILTNATSKARQEEALKAVKDYLVQKDGRLICLFSPPFDQTKKDPGYIKGYPPGIRENGGQYTHAAIWAVWAAAELKHGNMAYEMLNYLNPITHSLNISDANIYQVEPYVVAADNYSTSPHIGQGGWTWYTGSSGWLYRLVTEAILGFRLSGDYFSVDPCIPEIWDRYQIVFKYRETVFNITVENPDHIESGVKSISMDGKFLEDFKVPLLTDGDEHEINVVMGK